MVTKICVMLIVMGLASLVARPALAQDWGAWEVVLGNECACAGCSFVPGTPPAGCNIPTISCERRDTTISVDAEEPYEGWSEPCPCEYCPGCCTNPPCSCIGLPPTITCDEIIIPIESTIDLSDIAGCYSDAGLLEAMFREVAGYYAGSFDVRCECTASLCYVQYTHVRLIFQIVTVQMSHQWRMNRHYTPSTCTLAGDNYTNCGSDTSTMAFTIASGDCVRFPMACGPVCP